MSITKPFSRFFVGVGGVIATLALTQAEAPIWLLVVTAVVAVLIGVLLELLTGRVRSVSLTVITTLYLGVVAYALLYPRSVAPTMSLTCQRVGEFAQESEYLRYYLTPGSHNRFAVTTSGMKKPSEVPRTLVRCGFFNDGTVPIYNAVIQFQATFQKTIIDGPTSAKAGAVTNESLPVVVAPRVKEKTPFVFYIASAVDEFVTLKPVPIVKFESGGKQVTAPLILAGGDEPPLTFAPAFIFRQ